MSKGDKKSDARYESDPRLNYPREAFHGRSLAGCELLLSVDSYAPKDASALLPPYVAMSIMLRKGRKITALLPEQGECRVEVSPPYPVLYLAQGADSIPFTEYVIFRQAQHALSIHTRNFRGYRYDPVRFYAYCDYGGLQNTSTPPTHIPLTRASRIISRCVESAAPRASDFITRTDVRSVYIDSMEHVLSVNGDSASMCISGLFQEES